jgi:hypothetical protein
MTGGRDGFKMVIHGGQSSDGLGLNPVLSDTWRLDLSTMVWTSYPSDPVAPAISHAYVMPITNSTIVFYGGKTAANEVFGRTMVMHVTQGWRSVLPAGPRPEPRTGHVVTYDSRKHAMTVSHGISVKGELLNDTWVLYMSGSLGKWVCTQGADPACPQPVDNASDPLQRPPPLAGAAFASFSGAFFVFGGLVSRSNDRKVVSDEFWTISSSTDRWKRVRPDIVKSKHSFPLDVDSEKYERWKSSTVLNHFFKEEVKPPKRHQAAAAMIGPMADMQRPLLVVGGLSSGPGEAPNKMSLLDDIWIIDTDESSVNDVLRNGMLGFDGIDDMISIPLPAFVGTTRSMNGIWIEFWIQQKSIDGSVILWDAMIGDAVVLRAMLMAVGGSQFACLVYYPGDARQTNIKTWGPIATEGFKSGWHHIAFVMRFAHVARGSGADAILTQAFFFVDCEPQKDDGTFLLLDLKKLALSSGFNFIYVGGASSRASVYAKEGYQMFNGHMDNFRIWWVQCPPGPTKCNPFGFLYPQQDYAPYKRMPASKIHDKDVTIDDVAPILRDSMFTDQMPSNTTDLLVSIEVDHQDEGCDLIDTSTWLPINCKNNKEASTACPGCPEACFLDECWKFDADCFEPRLSEKTVSFYAENGTCRCLDPLTCPPYAEKCQCPAGFDRICPKKDENGTACISGWQCVCGNRMATECSRCMLNGNLQKPADPCLAPGTCRRSSCVFPFAKSYDTKRTIGSEIAEINSFLETIEMTNFATDMVGRYLDPGLYEKTKEYILNMMEYACYAYFDLTALVNDEWDPLDQYLKTTANNVSKQDDKRCNDPEKYADADFKAAPCKCTFEDSTVTEQTSLRKKVDQYWKSGASSYDRTSEALSKAPQMYNLTLALALICKAGGCWKNDRGQEDPSYCPTPKIDPAVFMDNLVGDKDKDNKLSETEFLDQYKVLSRLRAVTWDLDPMKCTSGESECDNMCKSSSSDPNSSSTCKCKRIKSTQAWDLSSLGEEEFLQDIEPFEGACVFANLEQNDEGDLKCAYSDYLLPPAAFFMHLATFGAKSPELDFLTAQRLFDVGIVTKLFSTQFDPDASGTVDMWELHCFYLEERDKRNSCYQDASGAFEDYGT